MFLVVNVIQTDETSFIVFLSNCSLVGYFFETENITTTWKKIQTLKTVTTQSAHEQNSQYTLRVY